MCTEAQIGEEYNPLKEVNKYGIENPFADPTRGRIADLVSADDGSVTVSDPLFVLQNLAGKQSLIGRSLTLTNSVSGSTDCCIIALEAPPAAFASSSTHAVEHPPHESYPVNYGPSPSHGYYH